MKAYEADLHDASEFYRWQSDMKAKDADNHWREVERRRLEMAACQQEAIEARFVLGLIVWVVYTMLSNHLCFCFNT